MSYHIIYDSHCNLCSTAVDILKNLDTEKRFDYIPMQSEEALKEFNITPSSCEQGMYLIDAENPSRRWQGSEAVEEITYLLPMGEVFISLYRGLPGAKWIGDRVYEQIRDNRYEWFGRRSEL